MSVDDATYDGRRDALAPESGTATERPADVAGAGADRAAGRSDDPVRVATAAKVQPYPKPGDVWRSRDRRDHGLTVTVLAVDEREGRVRIKRFRKATVSIRNWLRLYEFVSRAES